jgi:hypothetical protein
MSAAADWAEQEGDELGGTVSRTVDHFRRSQHGRVERYLYNQSLFEGRKISGNANTDYLAADGENGEWSNNDRLRLIRSAVQTACADVYARQKPKPQFLTSGADWRVRRRAKKWDKICEGLLAQRQGRWIDMWAMSADAAVEAVLQGIGPIRVMWDETQERITHELVPHIDLFVDPLEGREPQNLFYAQPFGEQKALRLWGEEEGISEEEKYKRIRAIKGAAEYSRFTVSSIDAPRASRIIRQDCAWQLPMGPNQPGKYAIAINGVLMLEAEWTSPAFPFACIRWEDHRDGFWASGLGDEGRVLAADAGELDGRLIARAIVASGKRTYIYKGSVNKQDMMANDEEVIIEVEPGQGLPSESVVPPFTPGEFDFAQARKQYFWDAIGISQTNAAARREPGPDSGLAIRLQNDINTGRQMQKSKQFENFFVDLAHQYVWRLTEVAETKPEFIVRWPGKTVMNEIKLEDARIPQDSFFIRVAPASQLPNDPSGRQAMIQQAFNSGWITADTAKTLVAWPDLDKELEGTQAEAEYIDSLLDRYLDADEATFDVSVDYESPEGMLMNKERALLRFLQTRFQAKVEKAPEYNVQLLTRYIREVEAELSAGRQAEAALQQGAPGAAGAAVDPNLAPVNPAAAAVPAAPVVAA